MDPIEAQRLEEEQRQAAREAELRDLGVVFDEPTGAGERVLARLRRECFGETSTTCELPSGAIDPYGTLVNEGQRAVVLWLEDELRQARAWRMGTPPPPATGIMEDTDERRDD